MDLAMANGDLEAARSGDRRAPERVLVRSHQDFRCYAGLTIAGITGPLGLTRESAKQRPHRARVPAREYLDS